MTTETTPVTVTARVKSACDIAASRTEADPNAPGSKITGAKKDLNAKGNGPEWYRLAWRRGSWQYVSTERLPRGNYLASDRRAEVYGYAFPGDIIVRHDRGGPVASAWLAATPNEDGKVLIALPMPTKRADGDLVFALPDGTTITTTDPRR